MNHTFRGSGVASIASSVSCFHLLFAVLLSCACSPAVAHSADEALVRGQQTLPLATVDFAGHRYVAEVDFGLDKPVRLMIHGNASVFLSLTHEIGEKLNGGPVKKVEDYGYSRRGKGLLTVPMMRFGDSTYANLRDVPVFDFSDEGGTPVQGMVGVRFLVAANAALDFSRDVIVLSVERSENPSKRLLGRGYKYAPLTMDAHGRVTIRAYFPSVDSLLPITPSTVSNALSLHHPLFAGKIPMTRVPSTDQSPHGTTPEVFLADSVRFEVEGVPFHSPASLENLAEYGAIPEAQLSSLGMLGFDWMKEHEAVIDYANRFLYFKP
jgi:hypothetical protein